MIEVHDVILIFIIVMTFQHRMLGISLDMQLSDYMPIFPSKVWQAQSGLGFLDCPTLLLLLCKKTFNAFRACKGGRYPRQNAQKYFQVQRYRHVQG